MKNEIIPTQLNSVYVSKIEDVERAWVFDFIDVMHDFLKLTKARILVAVPRNNGYNDKITFYFSEDNDEAKIKNISQTQNFLDFVNTAINHAHGEEEKKVAAWRVLNILDFFVSQKKETLELITRRCKGRAVQTSHMQAVDQSVVAVNLGNFGAQIQNLFGEEIFILYEKKLLTDNVAVVDNTSNGVDGRVGMARAKI